MEFTPHKQYSFKLHTRHAQRRDNLSRIFRTLLYERDFGEQVYPNYMLNISSSSYEPGKASRSDFQVIEFEDTIVAEIDRREQQHGDNKN